MEFRRVLFLCQAEDGIRDHCVTGVQTCALLISSRRRHTRSLCDWSSDVCSSDLLWPHIENQYREELKGIAEGLKAKGVALDVWDVVVLNAWLELTPYYTNWYDKEHKIVAEKRPVPEHCSAVAATGSYT